MKNIFKFVKPAYKLRHNSQLERRDVKLVRHRSKIDHRSKNLEPFTGRK